MTRYRGADLVSHARGATKKTSVRHYTLYRDRIVVEFKGGQLYTYSYASTDPFHVEEMRVLARSGAGLNRYINEHKPGYDPGHVAPGEQVESDEDYYGD